MLFLFSNKNGPLLEGANFMMTKNLKLHPGDRAFYLKKQENLLHKCHKGFGSNSQFNAVDCTLSKGEVAILIGHGGDDNRLYDEGGNDVTDAALRLMEKIATANDNKEYVLFLAACGGGVRQPNEKTSLLTTLVQKTPKMAEQLQSGKVACWSYTASAGLLNLESTVLSSDGSLDSHTGTHIYGTLTDKDKTEQHCGYDCRITTQLRRLENGQYLTIYFSPALYPLEDVIKWSEEGFKPPMKNRFPNLYDTLQLTQ